MKLGKGSEKNSRLSMATHDADHFRMQGAIWMFCTLLQSTDDTDLIYWMYTKIMDERYDLQVLDGKSFLARYVLEYCQHNFVDNYSLRQKLIWVFKEMDAEKEFKNLGIE